MKFMPIVPVSCMDLLDDWNDLFVLPDMMLDARYSWYVRGRYWDTVIVENGYYELGEALSVRYLEKIADVINGGTCIVVGPETASGEETVLKSVMVLGVKYPVLTILKGDVRRLWTLHQKALRYVGLVSKPTPYEGDQEPWYVDRVKYVKYIKGIAPDVYIHAFGCDSLSELMELKRAGADSCDSSFVCSRAIAGESLDAWHTKRVDLWAQYSEEEKEQMREALWEVKRRL